MTADEQARSERASKLASMMAAMVSMTALTTDETPFAVDDLRAVEIPFGSSDFIVDAGGDRFVVSVSAVEDFDPSDVIDKTRRTDL